MNTAKPWLKRAGPILLVLLLVACRTSGTGTPADVTPAERETTPTRADVTPTQGVVLTPTPVPTISPLGTPHQAGASYQPGDVISAENLTLAVLGWSEHSEVEGEKPEAGHKLLAVDMVLFKRGSIDSPLYRVHLRDTDGQQYDRDPHFSFAWDRYSPLNNNIALGEHARGNFVFQVPEASSEFVFVYEAREAGEADILVELGAEPVALEPPAELLTPEANIHPMGEIIDHGDMSLAVLGWRLSQGNENSRPAPGTKLMVLDVVLVNRGNEEQRFSPTERMTLRDATLRHYGNDRRFWYIPHQTSNFVAFPPGAPVRIDVVYQVPEASSDHIFVYGSRDIRDAKVFVALSPEPMALELPAEFATPGSDVRQMGEIVSQGDLSLVVLGWSESAGKEGVQLEEGNKFVVVDVLLVNDSGQNRSYGQFRLHDADLQQYRADTHYTPFQDKQLPLYEDLGPGERVRGEVAFQVPEASRGYVLALDAKSQDEADVFVELATEPVALELPTELLSPNPFTHRLGEVVVQGDLALTVLGWELSPGTANAQPDPDKQFLVVDVQLQNLGSQREDTNTPARRPKLRDADGYQYEIDSRHVFAWRPGNVFEQGLSPGEQVRDLFLYQVPLDSHGYVLLFDPEWLFHHGEGGDIIAVSLGETPVALEPSEGSLTPGTDVHQIGDVVSSGDVVLAVVGWESRPGQEAQSPLPAGMRFVVVDLVLVNQSQRALQVKQLGLKDQTGEAYIFASELAYQNGDENMRGMVVVSGERVRGQATFKVPQAVNDLVFNIFCRDIDGTNPTELFVALGPQPVAGEPPAELPGEQAIQTYAMNDAVPIGDLLLTMTGVGFTAKSDFGEPAPGRKFAVVDVTVQNTGSADTDAGGSEQWHIRDEQARYFVPHARAAGHPISLELLQGDIAPGATVYGQVGFQIPQDAQELLLVFRVPSNFGLAVGEGEPQKVFISLPLGNFTAQTPTPTPPETEVVADYAPGDLVEQGSLAFAVLGWSTPPEYGDWRPDPGKAFVAVDLLLINLGDQILEVELHQQMKLRDANLQQYNVGRAIGSDLGISPFELGLNPGERVRGEVLFQVAEGSSGYVFVLETATVSLGPEPTTTEPPAQLPGERPSAMYSMGEAVQVGTFLITATDFESAATIQFLQADEGKKFVIVSIEVQNAGPADAHWMNDYHLLLKDEKERVFLPDMMLAGLLGDIFRVGTSETLSGQVGFQVPDEAAELRFVFQVITQEPQKIFISLSP